MLRKIFKTGHSLAITLSPKALKELDLKEGDLVEVKVAEGQAVVRKTARSRQQDLGFKIRHHLGEKI